MKSRANASQARIACIREFIREILEGVRGLKHGCSCFVAACAARTKHRASGTRELLSVVTGNSFGESANRFLADGLLVPASLTAKLDRTFKTTALKPFLKKRGLSD
jgi:hypothetical protein